MIRVAALLLVFVVVLWANPVMPVVFSEIQTAPDSLERIELHLYAGDEPFDLSGAELVTNAGAAVIDSGLVIYPESNYVVIDSTNTTGVFSLGDDSDYVRLCIPGEDTFRLRYPADPSYAHDASWAPPSGTSASIYQFWNWQDPYWVDYYTWYIDGTPTFGTRNNDTLGGIAGHVYGDGGLPVDGATVRVIAAQGTAQHTSGEFFWPPRHGYFAQKPTGPGMFIVTADFSGYLPFTYPETIELAPNEGRDINVQLQRPDAVEEQAGSVTLSELHQRGSPLVVSADRPGTVLLSVHDNLGQLRVSDKVALIAGRNELASPNLRSGVYFACCRFGDRTLKTKLVLY
jgi:hypothetical protein